MTPTYYEGLSQNTIDLLLGRETTDCEFKQSLREVEVEYFVAFANASGGVILVGIMPDKQVAGCSKSDDEIRRSLLGRADTCRPSIVPLTQIQEEKTLMGKRVYRVNILEGNEKPYCTNGGLYKIRDDGQNRAIYPDEMKRIMLESNVIPARVKQLERELQKARQDTEQLAKKIPTADQVTQMFLDKIRGF